MPRIKPLSEVLNGVTRFGRLTVLGEAPRIVSPSGFAAVAAYVRCDCGVEKIVRGRGLVTGDTNSCGCLQRELTAEKLVERSRTHGHSGKGRTSEYVIWTTMKQRCHNPNAGGYEDYGARGISVCNRWRDSFENFLADMGPRPSRRHSLDREDNDGDYEPGNCVWAEPIRQASNKRNNRLLTIDGEEATMSEWSRRSGVPLSSVHKRLKAGWSPRDAVLTPTRAYGAGNNRP